MFKWIFSYKKDTLLEASQSAWSLEKTSMLLIKDSHRKVSLEDQIEYVEGPQKHT